MSQINRTQRQQEKHRKGTRKVPYNLSAGFTLVELATIAAIIAMITSIILATLQDARQKGRDARRIADARQTRNALELKYDKDGDYPRSPPPGPPTWTDSCTNPTNYINNLVSQGYVARLPQDPVNNNGYCYRYRGQDEDFKFAVFIEGLGNRTKFSQADGGVQADWYELYTPGARSWTW